MVFGDHPFPYCCVLMLEDSHRTHPPSDNQGFGFSTFVNLPNALKCADKFSRQLKCVRDKSRENDRVLFFAVREKRYPVPANPVLNLDPRYPKRNPFRPTRTESWTVRLVVHEFIQFYA